MNRRNILLIAGAAVGIGLLLIVGAFIMSGFQVFSAFPKTGTAAESVSEEYVFEDAVSNIDIQVIASDVRFERSNDGKTRVESRHSAQLTETVEVKHGTLSVKQKKAQKGINVGIDLSNEEDKLTVYLPQSDYDELTVQTVSGNVELDGLNVKKAELETVSGELELKNLVAAGQMTIGTVSGDVELDGCDAGEIEIVTVSGEVEGTLLSPKAFDVHTTSGKIDVPASESGAPRCKINTTSGDVELKLAR